MVSWSSSNFRAGAKVRRSLPQPLTAVGKLRRSGIRFAHVTFVFGCGFAACGLPCQYK